MYTHVHVYVYIVFGSTEYKITTFYWQNSNYGEWRELQYIRAYDNSRTQDKIQSKLTKLMSDQNHQFPLMYLQTP